MHELRTLFKKWPWVVLGLLVSGAIIWSWIWPESFYPWEGLVLAGLGIAGILVLTWYGETRK
jgi:polyferredoxin